MSSKFFNFIYIVIEELKFTLFKLPRATKICFTLYVKNHKEMIPLGWVNFQLFDHYNILKTGQVTLPLWLDGRANPLSMFEL